MKRTPYTFRFTIVSIALVFINPSLGLHKNNFKHSSLNLFGGTVAQAGAMQVSGMRSSGMRNRNFTPMRHSNFGSMRPRSPINSRYYGGNFPRIKRPVNTRPITPRPIKPVAKPIHRPLTTKPQTKPVKRPVKKPVTKPIAKPLKPTPPPKPLNPKPTPPGNSGHGHDHPGHEHHPHHGHHHHHHYHHYPYHGWGGYWPWFWGSAITIGAIVSTIPDDECQDVYVEDKWYKECQGVLFEPVYEDGNVQYEVVELNRP